MTGDGERKNRVKDFSFDFSYWSADERSRNYSSQERVSAVNKRSGSTHSGKCSNLCSFGSTHYELKIRQSGKRRLIYIFSVFLYAN